MSEHESVLQILALASAGALDAGELQRVQRHVQACEACRRELEIWSTYTQALRELPQPSVAEDLVARTQARLVAAQASAADGLVSDLLLGGLALLGWAVSLTAWFLIHELSRGSISVFGMNLVSAVSWSVVSTVAAWITAAATAVMLGREMRRRV